MKENPSIKRLEMTINRLRSHWTRDLRRSLWASLLCLSLGLGYSCPAASAKVHKRALKPKAVTPTVTGIQAERLVPAEGAKKSTIPLSLEISGKGFGKTLPLTSVRVTLINKESGLETRAIVKIATDDKIIARAEAPVDEDGSSECTVELEIDGKLVDTTDISSVVVPAEKASMPGSLQGTESSAQNFEVEVKAFKTNIPNLHSLAITTKNDEQFFPADPNLVKVAILPAGWTNLTIAPGVSPQKMFVQFLAPEDFEVKDVLVTVYDSHGKVVGYNAPPPPSKDDEGKPIAKQKAANGDVTISSVDILSLQRRDGFGRLKISGSGFGNYGRPPINGDIELLCDSENRTNRVEERKDEVSSLCTAKKDFAGIKDWRQKIEGAVNVQLVPRNPDLRVERTLIMYIDDKVIDVYFEFSHFKNFSEPFRLESASVTVNKEDAASTAETKSAHASSGAPVKKSVTYLAAHLIGPPKDTNLQYRYTVLDEKDASRLFGSGVGGNFYVIQLSLINGGDKKVIVPLSSIQAEIEWAYGDGNGTQASMFYDEGPPTLSPLPLSAISGYFDAFQKTNGRKTRLFNVLDGVVTLGASLVPVFGNGIAKPTTILSGGFMPGLRKSLGDLSGQQLQNLTSMSWDTVEEIPANGGTEKFVYIQRSDQKYGEIHRKIKSIGGLEVSGFVVRDSAAATAVKQQ